MLIRHYKNNSLRRAKTDKKDAIKLANYALKHWLTLPRYFPVQDTRLTLKNCYHQYVQYTKMRTMMKNNLISLLDSTFPNANRLFNSSHITNGREKWLDFVATFWHCECICNLSEKVFIQHYQKGWKKHDYNFSKQKAFDIYVSAYRHVGVIPKMDTAKLLIQQAVAQLQTTSSTLVTLAKKDAYSGWIFVGVSRGDADVWLLPPLDLNSWRKSEMHAAFIQRKLWWLLLELTYLLTSLVQWMFVAEIFPNEDHLHFEKHFFSLWVWFCGTHPTMNLCTNSWIRSDPQESFIKSTWWILLTNFCVSFTPP